MYDYKPFTIELPLLFKMIHHPLCTVYGRLRFLCLVPCSCFFLMLPAIALTFPCNPAILHHESEPSFALSGFFRETAVAGFGRTGCLSFWVHGLDVDGLWDQRAVGIFHH
jgi:hypothetical protein